MQKLIKRCDQVIAFIRKQEQDFLRPACEAMGSTSMRVTMSMDSILTEKKFSQYQKDNDLFMRDLASLAGIREQALDRAEKAVGQSRDMLLKNQQAIYANKGMVCAGCCQRLPYEAVGMFYLPAKSIIAFQIKIFVAFVDIT